MTNTGIVMAGTFDLLFGRAQAELKLTGTQRLVDGMIIGTPKRQIVMRGRDARKTKKKGR